jgi:hypothetical protein
VVAATFLMIAGAWHVIAAIAALVHDNVYVATPQYIYSFDLTAWGLGAPAAGRPGDRRRIRGAQGTRRGHVWSVS